MRPDMHKVIVERPRRGSRGPFRHAPWEKNASPDDLPTKEGVRKRFSARGSLRSLNENLSPLQRYLQKQVGRPWNAVYSDICAHLRPASAVQQHVRDHLWDYVERHVTLGPKGAVFGAPRFLQSGRQALRPDELYVHLETGLLLAVKRKRFHK